MIEYARNMLEHRPVHGANSTENMIYGQITPLDLGRVSLLLQASSPNTGGHDKGGSKTDNTGGHQGGNTEFENPSSPERFGDGTKGGNKGR